MEDAAISNELLGTVLVLRTGLKNSRRRSRSDRPRRKPSRARYLFWAGFFFVLGIIGVLIPIMPQIPFFLMSLLFLSLVFPGVRRRLRRFLHRHPRAAHVYRKWRSAGRKKRQEAIRKEKLLAGR